MSIVRRIAETIAQARKRLGLKQEALGSLVGCSASYITKIERGHAVPSPVMSMKLEKSLRLKKGALVDTVLRLRLKETRLKREAILNARSGARDAAVRGHALVPLVHKLYHCTDWSPKEVERWVAIPKEKVDGKDVYLLRALDDCMDREGISPGDLLLVENRPVQDGEVCVYCEGPDYHVRRYFKHKDHVEFVPSSFNPVHKPAVWKGPHPVDFRGVVRNIYLKTVQRLKPI